MTKQQEMKNTNKERGPVRNWLIRLVRRFFTTTIVIKDTYAMTDKERKTLSKIARRLVVQSHRHQTNIEDIYRIVKESARLEFTEDNDPTLNAFLRECFDKSV